MKGGWRDSWKSFFHSNNRRRGSKSSIKNQRHSHFYTQFFWGLEKWTSRRTFSQTDKVAGRGRRTGIELGRSKRLVWACSTVFGVFFLGMDLMRHSHTQKIFSLSPNWKRVIFFGYNVANLKLPIVLYGTTPCLSLLWKRRKLFFWHPPLEIRFSNWKVVVQRRRTVDNKKKRQQSKGVNSLLEHLFKSIKLNNNNTATLLFIPTPSWPASFFFIALHPPPLIHCDGYWVAGGFYLTRAQQKIITIKSDWPWGVTKWTVIPTISSRPLTINSNMANRRLIFFCFWPVSRPSLFDTITKWMLSRTDKRR